jgi:multimeric flavodoxin WrbA
MKITLVDGSMPDYPHQHYSSLLAAELIDKGHQVNLLKASHKKINYCTGCWSCWWKTPGECMHKDDMPEFYRSYLQSDLVLHFSPLKMGFISSLLKTVNDRSITLVHPYMAIVNNEMHHRKRYENYPFFGLIVDPMDADNEDLQITKDLYARLALNLKTELRIFTTNQKSMEELTNEISHI